MNLFLKQFLVVSILSLSFCSVAAEINFDVDEKGNTELHNAVNALDVEQVKTVLGTKYYQLDKDRLKDFVNFRDGNGETTLHVLARLAIKAEGISSLNQEVDEEEGIEDYPKIKDLKKILNIINLLISNGADVSAISQIEVSPIYYFRDQKEGSKEFEQIRSLLRVSCWKCIIS